MSSSCSLLTPALSVVALDAVLLPSPVSQLFLGWASEAFEPENHSYLDPVLGKLGNII